MPSEEPTIEDVRNAIVWQQAIAYNSPMWRELRPEQQAMVQARIDWALPREEG